MGINKLVDPGEVYVIGQYAIGTITPTNLYKIGIVQNERKTEDRIDEHQTGNPNRLFIAAKIPSEASLMVEQQMHRNWNSVRVGKEWFEFVKSSDVLSAIAEIKSLEATYGPPVKQLRNIYYTSPISGHNTTLTPGQITQAENIRDESLALLEKMALLKYQYETYSFQLRLANGLQPTMDSVTSYTISPSKTEFKDSKLPTALKAKYMTKIQKNKADFRFNYAGIRADIGGLKLGDSYWKTKFNTEHAFWEQEKAAWKKMESTINPISVNPNQRSRNTAAEALHQLHTDSLTEFNRLRSEKEVLELECRMLCGGYESIDGVCTWKRAPQNNAFNLQEFKIKVPLEYINPAYYSTSSARVSVKAMPYKTYR
jgi:hypothetical protein|tara:strand:+ start:10 stop:1119 length:1110 start_codon:yes stop_codon:yes gene_type:complete